MAATSLFSNKARNACGHLDIATLCSVQFLLWWNGGLCRVGVTVWYVDSECGMPSHVYALE